MKIKFLGAHNSESRNTRLVSLLIDDILAVDAGSLATELSFSEQEKIKAILLSHGHYDHIRGVPAFAFNNTDQTTRIFALPQTLKFLSTHFINGLLYPKFTEKIPFFLEKPSLEFVVLESHKSVDVEEYRVLPLPVNHTIDTVGFEITSKDEKKVFYTGDTGPGLSAIWKYISPQLIITDVTFPNRLEKRAKNSKHLCPKLLKEELLEFHRIKEYFPHVILIHLFPKFEDEIKEQAKELSKELDISIDIAYEGKEIKI